MPILTRLTQQKKDPTRINIFLDGQYAFALDLETVTKHHLKPKLELTTDQVKQLLHEGEYQRIYNLTLKLIARRPRSEQELDQWFYKKEITSVISEPIKQKLRDLNLLNDLEFAHWWIDQRLTHRPKGPAMLRVELQAKGISSSIIKQALADIPDTSEAITQLAHKKLRTITRYDVDQQRQKLLAFLQRKGYSYGKIKPIIDELLPKSYT